MLGLNYKSPRRIPLFSPCNTRQEPDSCNNTYLERYYEFLQAWMVSKISGGAIAMVLFISVGKSLSAFAIETAD